MVETLSITIAQLNPTVGDLEGNLRLIRDARAGAAADGADILLTPELSVAGYAPEDMVLKPAFQTSLRDCVETLARETADGGPAMVVGAPWLEDGRLYNAALVLDGGEIAGIVRKHDLPNYGVFDEKRVFASAPLAGPVELRGVRLGLMICEDMWYPAATDRLAAGGADILAVMNASPFETDKTPERLSLARARVRAADAPIIVINQVGGQDEVIFDGTSFVLNRDGREQAQFPGFRAHIATTRWRRAGGGWACDAGEIVAPYDDHEAIYQACMLGLSDYLRKNRFPGVIIGLSGGVDSALTAAMAVDALGPDKVRTVMMPSRFTSRDSLEDAAETARLLGVRLDSVPIAPGVAAFEEMLAPLFAGRDPDVTEENIQARLRGVILMALSNKFGDMLLTTGNKSEMSVGYATLYGDMAGGYSVLKDIYKTTAYALCRWRNANLPNLAHGPAGRVIPERVITKPATAELAEDQTDQDSLPPYDELDDILHCLIEGNMGQPEIVARGHDAATVARVEHMLYIAEYKRRQAPPGVKITRRSFGRDRRYPITNGFRTARRSCP